MRKEYKITGAVLGHLWGSGKGWYKAETLSGNNKTALIKRANKMLNDGSLDSGMGFQSLAGAYLTIETISIVSKDDKEYQRSDFEEWILGNITEEEKIYYQNNVCFDY